MQISTNINLKPYHTFGIEVYAEAFTELHDIEDLYLLKSLKNKYQKLLILGEGSNVLFTQNFLGIVVRNRLKGINIIDETEREVTLKVASGVNWHEFVQYTVQNNWGGIENLSLIPGTVGAAPMQNIGAYGVEVKDVIKEVHAFEIDTETWKRFDTNDCQFGYRESIFKHAENRDKYFITHVIFQLIKNPDTFNISYGDIQNTLKEMEPPINVKCISEAVSNIRNKKLPNPKDLGNAGSFYKNPVISAKQIKELLQQYPQMPHYPLENGEAKIPAAWLIEQCGWKGLKIGNTGNHLNQALVIVNYGNATGDEIRNHSINVQKSVKDKFGILLLPEVNFIHG